MRLAVALVVAFLFGAYIQHVTSAEPALHQRILDECEVIDLEVTGYGPDTVGLLHSAGYTARPNDGGEYLHAPLCP